jgi:hypothetical protein
MNIINNPDFATVQKTISALAEKNPHWFPDDFKGIHTVDCADMFAGYHQGAFYFSNQDALVEGFAPALELTKAIEKINAKQALTFNEEYAVETLWHEMMHGRASHHGLPAHPKIRHSIEGVHQWLSRQTYHELLEALNLMPNHQQAIIQAGLAYQQEVSNLTVLLNTIGLQTDAILLKEVMERWMSVTPADLARDKVLELLAEKSQMKTDKLKRAIAQLSSKSDKFKAHVKNLMSY